MLAKRDHGVEDQGGRDIDQQGHCLRDVGCIGPQSSAHSSFGLRECQVLAVRRAFVSKCGAFATAFAATSPSETSV